MAHHATHHRTLKKVVASGVVLAAGAALLSGGVYASWTSEATVDQGVGAVDLSAGFVETGGADHVFQTIEDAFPGDHWTRYATLHNGGSLDQQFAVRVDTVTDGLTEDEDGLRAVISTCTVAFDVDGGCEVGDHHEVQAGYYDADDHWVPPVYEPNPDDDAVQVLADGFITPAGKNGSTVHVSEGGQLHFKITYTLDAGADQARFEGAQDTALVQVKSLTAQRPGIDRTNG